MPRKTPKVIPGEGVVEFPTSWNPSVAERQVAVARYYAQGYSQKEIGELLGCGTTTVQKDLVAVKARWVEMAMVSMSERRGKELDRIDWIERECEEEWHRSKRASRTTKTTTEAVLRPKADEVNGRIPKGNAKGWGKNASKTVGKKVPEMKLEPVRRYVERASKTQCGDIRFIQQIAWCIEMRLKIFGVLEETKAGDTNIINLSWDQLESRVRTQAPDVVEERLRLAAMPVVTNGVH